MRRTGLSDDGDSIVMGIISAHAENSILVVVVTPGMGDHLRACGEQTHGATVDVRVTGSSPRMRRTASVGDGCNAGERIISAHAENRRVPRTAGRWRRDHLRACGEQLKTLAPESATEGSSPRMRRTDHRAVVVCGRSGIISAHAENSIRPTALAHPCRDHLRACGEQLGRRRLLGTHVDHLRACGEQVEGNTNNRVDVGSSPRMRRTGDVAAAGGSCAGIISAHAENSLTIPHDQKGLRDHLRACGEQDMPDEDFEGEGGSSPRMRRTVFIIHCRLSRIGIISAHAENRCEPPARSIWGRDHLRACGEQVVARAPEALLTGSSPRMRRTGTDPFGTTGARRIISAHAENSSAISV